jgi:hypothetical protein
MLFPVLYLKIGTFAEKKSQKINHCTKDSVQKAIFLINEKGEKVDPKSS